MIFTGITDNTARHRDYTDFHFGPFPFLPLWVLIKLGYGLHVAWNFIKDL